MKVGNIYGQRCCVTGRLRSPQAMQGNCSPRVRGVWGHDGECPQDSTSATGIKAECVLVFADNLSSALARPVLAQDARVHGNQLQACE